VPLVTLHSTRRSLGEPLVDYLRELERTYSNDQLVVLIPEVQPARPWQRILHNQRGFVIEQAIQRSGVNVVICRLRYRLSAVAGSSAAAGHDTGAGSSTGASRQPGGPELPPYQPPGGQAPSGSG